MAYTDNFRRQHQEILAIAGEIGDKLKAGQARKDPNVLRTLLSSLAGKLSIHLAMEDKALYPRMIESKDDAASTMARKFQLEMGDLGQAFASYNRKWQTASSIAADPDGFGADTQAVFTALGNRIQRETHELYPRADTTL